MGNISNSQDDESKPVPPQNEAGGSHNEGQTPSGENPTEPGHGTVEDVVDSNVKDGAESEIDATVADIESMNLEDEAEDSEELNHQQDAANKQGDGTVGDVTEVESFDDGGQGEVDLDATFVDIDPTVGLESDGKDENGTVSGLGTVETDEASDSSDFDPNATLEDLDSSSPEESENAGVAKVVDSGKEDVDAEVDLDATVNELDATFVVDDHVGGDADADSGDGDSPPEDIDQTIMEGDIDQTVMGGPDGDLSDGIGNEDRPAIRTGDGGKAKGGRGKVESTIRDAQEATYDGYDSHPSVQTVDSSVLGSGDIEQTINPRELSDEEASAWSLAAQSEAPKADQTVKSGAGPRRTWVDHQFSRLRERSVSSGKEKQNVDDDYRLVRKLGQGGMGDVFVARQGSLNRLLALKLIKPLDGERRAQLERLGKLQSVEEERRQQFLSEAIVTGDLDHPNIVPIHDVAVTSENELFYSMKRVVGTPWSKVIKKNSREENLEILMKSCDAIGFAHERGVVHRDIKPENIMLGDFGVVMVMDWGLALPTSSYDKHDSVFATSGLGGTPAFMAPEMVTGPLEKIGPTSDVYLLGATLFMIVTGSAPHKAKSVTECLKSVRRNTIRKVSAAEQGELLDIAMKAMATKPEDRYPDVASFQNDIRAYREHAESISLTVRATEDLELGQGEASYAPLSRAAFRYEEALKSWGDNEKAKQGLEKTKLVHAKIASDKGDYDFGLSLLDKDNQEHADLIHQLNSAIELRDSHAARVAVLRKAAMAMLAFIIIFGSGALYFINASRSQALVAQKKAEDAREEALAAEEKAVVARVEEQEAKEKALAAEGKAVVARIEAEASEKKAVAAQFKEKTAKENALAAEQTAVRARKQAVEQRSRAVYEEYISKIALAKARLERNEADGAREILLDLRSNVNSVKRTQGWEWRWLWRQANQSTALGVGEFPVIDLAVTNDGTMGAIAGADGRVQLIRLGSQTMPVERVMLPLEVLGDMRATTVALSLDGQQLAIGTAEGNAFVVTGLADIASLPERVISTAAHKRGITDMCFGSDGTLWTASDDRTVKSWKQASDGALVEGVVGWHFLPVRQIALADRGGETFLAAVVGDGKTGKVVIWEQTEGSDGSVLKLLGRMSDHPVPPSAVTFDTTGRRVASGDIAGNVLVWDRSEVSEKGEEEFRKSIENAVKQTTTGATRVTASSTPDVIVGVVLKDIEMDSDRRLVPSVPPSDRVPASTKAHGDAVETIRFSENGKSLLTASDDYTVKLWDLSTGAVSQTLRGHGGWVVGADFVAGKDNVVISASDDSTVRLWNAKTYVGAFKSQQTGGALDSTRGTTQDASDPREEIWSASFSPDGKQIVIARGDHKAEVIRVDEESLAFHQVSELSLDEGTEFVAMSMQVDQSHGLLYIGSGDETIRVWDLERGVQVGSANKTGLNTAFALSSDGAWLLTGSSDSNTRGILWRLDPTGNKSPELVHRLLGKPGQEGVSCFAISPESTTLFTGDDFGIGLLWDVQTGQQIGEPIINVRGSRINDAVYSSDGRSVLVAADNAAVTQIDLQTRAERLRLQQLGYVSELCLSKDGQQMLTVCEVASKTYIKTFATLWNLNSGLGTILDLTVTPRLGEAGVVSRARITSARFDPDNKTVLVSRTADESDKSEIRVWPVEQLMTSNQFMDAEQMNQVVVEAMQSSNGGTVFVMPAVRGDTEGVLPLDSERLLTMNNNGVFLWNLKTKREERSYRSHAELTEAAFSFDSKYIATASRSVKIWDAVSGKALAKIESEKPIRTIQFSPVRTGQTGYMFATGGDGGVVKFWEFNPQTQMVKPFAGVAAGTVAAQNAAQSKAIHRICFSKDGDRLWIVGDQGLARLQDLRNAAKTITLEVPGNQSLKSAAISDDGAFIAAGSSEKNVLVWQLPQAELGLQLVTLSGHAGVVNDVGLIGNDTDNLRVFSASQDGTTRVWDPRFASTEAGGEPDRGREIISLRRHQGDVTSLDTTKDGDLLMTAGSDGAVFLWPADPPVESNTRKP
ncbi:protein kinase [Rhodopirellula sp.]|nr:protein kinase [Rhodopirellula sp.]